MALTLTTTSCTGTAGNGVVTTWTLLAYTGTWTESTTTTVSDGYKITASLTW